MTIIKSERELDLMRKAGKIVAECHQLVREIIRPGITTLEIDAVVEKTIREKGAIPSFINHHDFSYSICSAPNDVICHGFPDNQPLKEGDVITIDIGACYQGYHGDSGWTYAVGTVSEDIQMIMEHCERSLYLGIQEAVAGQRIGDIGYVIDHYAREHHYGNVYDFTGHGVGREIWEEPTVPHYGIRNKGARLKKGMVIAIEPMFTLGKTANYTEDDGWTVRTVDHSICVQYEHTVAITENGPEILTKV